jgi:RNA polymerase sigma factor (sigma-70 family)
MTAQQDLFEDDEDYLLSEFRRGNPEAMRHVFLRFWKIQVFFARSYVPEAEIAEEVASDAFLKLWNKREGFSSMAAIRSFLYVTTRNGCVDQLRKAKRQRQNNKDYRYLESDEVFDDPMEMEIINTELLEKMLQAIDILPNQYKKVMHLIASGMGTDEIAEKMNLSPKIIRNYKARAIMMLKKDLEGRNFLIILLMLSLTLR